ncbi:MAG TPA: diaminopimelate epimerase [Nevskiales bacterium]|nr:diaminopimelate epimerase [Nevskiales bacterium]
MLRKFTKMHGLGNDFVLFDATREPLSLTAAQARFVADRHFGIGCDQILLVEPPPAPDVDFFYRILNSDGSESAQCGNGARCFLHFVREQGLTAKSNIRVRTIKGIYEMQLLPDGQVRVNMGVPEFEPARIPIAAETRADTYRLMLDEGHEVEFAALSMGNPHAVLRVDDAARAPVAALGPLLEPHPFFPERVNVGFLQVLDRGHGVLRVYERGAGETLACGSGACAAMAAGRRLGWFDDTVELRLPGGTLRLEWAGEGQPLYMTGPAQKVFEGEVEL